MQYTDIYDMQRWFQEIPKGRRGSTEIDIYRGKHSREMEPQKGPGSEEVLMTCVTR